MAKVLSLPFCSWYKILVTGVYCIVLWVGNFYDEHLIDLYKILAISRCNTMALRTEYVIYSIREFIRTHYTKYNIMMRTSLLITVFSFKVCVHARASIYRKRAFAHPEVYSFTHTRTNDYNVRSILPNGIASWSRCQVFQTWPSH